MLPPLEFRIEPSLCKVPGVAAYGSAAAISFGLVAVTAIPVAAFGAGLSVNWSPFAGVPVIASVIPANAGGVPVGVKLCPLAWSVAVHPAVLL